MGIARDITALKRAEDALRQSEERYERAANAGRVGVWEWDLSTGEMHIDPNLKSLLGFENAEIGNHVDDRTSHVHPADIERVRDAAETCTGGEPLRYELEHRMVHKDGSVRWFQARGTVLQDHEGKPRRMVGTDLDVTSLKRAEEEKALLEAKLRHSRVQKHKSLQIFATAIVESLGDMVMNILNGAGTAQWDTLSTNSIPRRATDEVRDGMVRTSELLSKLQTYTGERKPETEGVDLNALVADMDPVLQRLSRNLTLKYRLAEGLPRFDGAPKDIRGVILNLVENSIQSLESGRGTVTILTGSEELKPLTVCEAVTSVSLPAGRYVFL